MKEMVFSIDHTAQPIELPHTWSCCVGAGRACEGLRAGWQAQLRKAVQECGFRYIRFHGLLSDDMFVYAQTENGPSYSFQYIDELFDALLRIGIRPVVEFSFCPQAMASGSKTLFWWRANISPPRDFSLWADLLAACCRHWVERYGPQEVRQWYFEIWNEPNLSAFWDGTRTQYFEMYAASVRAIKAVDPNLRVGGPATSNFVPDGRFDGEREDVSQQLTHKLSDLDAVPWHGVWIETFLEYCRENQVPLDFVSTHPYPTDFALDGHGECTGRSRKAGSLLEDIRWLQSTLKHSGYGHLPLLLTEWSCSPSSRDCAHDYLPAATYVVKSNLEVAGQVACLSYWTFTDVFEEEGGGRDAFHGGFGMMNFNGIQKPVYHAYRMLNQLGDYLLQRNEHWAATQTADGRFSAIFWNYPAQQSQTVPMAYYPNHPAALAQQQIQEKLGCILQLSNLRPNACFCLELLDSDHGTATTLWTEMGCPADLTPAQAEMLHQYAAATRKIVLKSDGQGVLYARFELPAWGIGLLQEL